MDGEADLLEGGAETRRASWQELGERMEAHLERLAEPLVVPSSRASVPWSFDTSRPWKDVLVELDEGLRQGTVQTGHPRYFGLPHAAPSSLAVLATTLASAVNPQLATARHAPFAVAAERAVLEALGRSFGFEEPAGTMTSGGAEANLTALVVALAHRFPEWEGKGLRGLPGAPRVYVSAEGHPTVARAVRVVGLGGDGLRVVPTDATHRMKLDGLRRMLAEDVARGDLPLAVVATAGTTSAGAIDPLTEVASLARKSGAWLHVDAAWGGLLALIPERRDDLRGIELADSIAFDPHKALAMPLGTSMLLTRHPHALAAAFRDRAGYMPRDAGSDPYAHGLAWSRRFASAPLFAVLRALGFQGLAGVLRRSLALGDELERRLSDARFVVRRASALPVVSFVDGARDDGATPRYLEALARAVIATGDGWISVTRSSNGVRALRASIPNHRTSSADVERLVSALARARGAS